MRVTSFSKEVDFTPEFNGNKALPETEQLKAVLSPLQTLEVIDITEVLHRWASKALLSIRSSLSRRCAPW
jgi:hypothetical protein